MSSSLRSSDPHGFLVLPENRLALAAVKRLGPRVQRTPLTVVTLVGPPGSGKSHLARELLRTWEAEKVSGRLVLVTAGQFAAELADASVNKTISRFQAKYRKRVKLLIVEDLQELARKSESQQQLTAALDEVIARGGAVLTTSTRMPGAIAGLSKRLVNRLHGGTCVEIRLPGEDSRRKLLRHFLSRESIRLSQKEVDLAAARCAGSPRELLGLLSQLNAGLSATGARPGKETAPLLHAALEAHPSAPELSIEAIAAASAQKFGVSVADLRGPRRSQTISLSRQAAMWLARDLLGMNYADIGRYFRRDNHSTVIHACRKVGELLAGDDPAAGLIRQLADDLSR